MKNWMMAFKFAVYYRCASFEDFSFQNDSDWVELYKHSKNIIFTVCKVLI